LLLRFTALVLLVGAPAALCAQERPATPQAQEMTMLEAAYRNGGLGTAVATYELLARRGPDHVLLNQLARWAVTAPSTSSDEVVRHGACIATLPYTRDKACLATLQAAMGDNNAPFAIRLMAVNALRRAKDPFAEKALATIAREAAAQNPIAAAPLLREVDPSVSVPLLRAMLASADPQAQFAAAAVLSRTPGAAARAALAERVDELRGSARIAAVAGLAASGGAQQREETAAALPLLGGFDLFLAAEALQRAGDSRGTKALTGLLGGDDESLALEAADALKDGVEKTRARAAIRAALASKNPIIRAQALKIWVEAGWPSDVETRKRLADADPTVRIEAASVVFRETSATPPRQP
jgi:hypothetical protein